MDTRLFTILLGTLLPLFLVPIARANELEDRYFAGDNPKLTRQEHEALTIVQRWQTHGDKNGGKVFAGRNGAIVYVFGVQAPSVVCAVLQVCDIALQAGEQVNSIQLGDTARWNIEPAISGTGAGEVQHLLIKPMDVGLQTSLVVTTDRRTYHIRLRSHRSKYMPQVAFTYPEEALAKWDKIRALKNQRRTDNTLPASGEYLGDLSFDYDLSGTASWKPVRVYNDGRKTIIQMPGSMAQSEAPTLLVVRGDRGLFSAPETVLVNYRVQGDRYIVDTVFEKAILIAGVGHAQDRITITRRK